MQTHQKSSIQAAFSTLLAVTLFLGCTSVSTRREMASEQASTDRVRVATLDVGPDERLVILGVDHPDHDIPTLNLASLASSTGRHFSGSDIGTVDPHFMISLNKTGVQKIRSFELERFGHVAGLVYNQASKPAVRNSYYQMDHPESASVLPAEFLDVPRAAESLTEATIIDIVLQGGQFAPVGGELAALLKNMTTESEDARRAEAGYLLNWIESALQENKIPELRKAFSENELREIGSAIVLRYNLNSKYAGLFVGNKNKEKYFDQTEQKLKITEAKQMQQLVDFAKSESLIVKPLNGEFAFVFYDDRDDHLDTHWREYFKRYPLPKKHPLSFPPPDGSNALHLIPVGIFALSNEHRPMPLMDLKNSGRIGSVPRLVKLVDVATDLAFSYFPIDEVIIAANVGVYGLRFAISKSDLTIFDDRVMSYASLEALLDAGYIQFDFSQLLVDYLYKNAAALGVEPARLTHLRDALRSGNAKASEKAAKDLLSLDARGEAERGFLYGVRTFTEIQDGKKIVIQRLQNWLSNPEKLSELERKLKRRESSSN